MDYQYQQRGLDHQEGGFHLSTKIQSFVMLKTIATLLLMIQSAKKSDQY